MTLRQKLINEPRIIYRFIRAFGSLQGLRLYQKFKLRKVGDLVVPGIKHPFGLRNDKSDYKVFHQIFLSGNDDYLNKVDNVQVIVDGGANIGLNAIKFKNRFPQARIICVEPDTDNFETLKKNVAPYENMVIENCALWSKDTMLSISDKFGMGKWAMTVEEDNLNGNVKGQSVRTLMDRNNIHQIDIVKLDIETSEKNLFSSNYSDWLPYTRVIIIELHDHMLPGCAKAFFEAINSTFKNYDYSHAGEYTVIVNKDISVK